MAVLSNLKLTDDEMWDKVLEIIKRKKHEIEKKDLVTICLALAIRKKGDERLWNEFEGIVMNLNQEFDAKFLSNIAWCFSLRGFASPEFWSFIKKSVETKLPTFTSQGISTCLWAFVKSKVLIESDLLESILKAASSQIDNFNSADLGMLLWSLGRLPKPRQVANSEIDTILTHTEAFILKNKDRLADIDLIHSLFGFHRLKGGSDGFWEQMEGVVKSKVEGFNEEGLSSILNVAVDKFSSGFWIGVIGPINKSIKTCSVKAIRNYINGFGNLKENHQTASTTCWINCEEQILIRFSSLSAMELSEVGVSLARFSKGTTDFWRKHENFFIDYFKTFDLKSKSNRFIFTNLLQSTFYSNILTPSINVVYLPVAKEFLENSFCTINEIHIIATSYGKARISDDKLWYTLEKKIKQIGKRIDPYKLVEISKYFSIMKKGTEAFWSENLEKIHQSRDSLSLSMISQILIYIAHEIPQEEWFEYFVQRIESEKKCNLFTKAVKDVAFNKKLHKSLRHIRVSKLKETWATFPSTDRSKHEKEFKEVIETLQNK